MPVPVSSAPDDWSEATLYMWKQHLVSGKTAFCNKGSSTLFKKSSTFYQKKQQFEQLYKKYGKNHEIILQLVQYSTLSSFEYLEKNNTF